MSIADDPRKRAERLLAQSPFAMPRVEVLAHIERRRRCLLAPPLPPEPDFMRPEPSPLPIVDAPEKFGADFALRKGLKQLDDPPPPPKPRPKKPQAGRTPVGVSPEAARRFRIIDGDGEGGGDKPSRQ